MNLPPSERHHHPCCGLEYHAWNCANNPDRAENLRQVLLTELGNTDWKAIDGRGLTVGELESLLDIAVRIRVDAGF